MNDIKVKFFYAFILCLTFRVLKQKFLFCSKSLSFVFFYNYLIDVDVFVVSVWSLLLVVSVIILFFIEVVLMFVYVMLIGEKICFMIYKSWRVYLSVQ